MNQTGIDALRRAKDILGSQEAIAQIVGVKQPSVHHALTKAEKVPAEWCIPLEKATEGEITRHDLRPDLYPREGAAA